MSSIYSSIFKEWGIICLWVLPMSWYSFRVGKLDFQSEEHSRRSTSRYVYTLSVAWWVVPLVISSKILLCDNSEMVTWFKELKYRELMRLWSRIFHSLCLGLVGVCWDWAAKSKTWYNKLDLIVSLLSFQSINIDLSIQTMSFTLYMTWVH